MGGGEWVRVGGDKECHEPIISQQCSIWQSRDFHGPRDKCSYNSIRS